MAKVKFVLSSTFSGWLFWSVNHTAIYENSELHIFKNMKFVGKDSKSGQMIYLKQMYTKLLNSVDNHCWQR